MSSMTARGARANPLVTGVLSTLLGGFSAIGFAACGDDVNRTESGARTAEVSAPGQETMVLAEDDPASLALEMSQSLFESSPAAVLAPNGVAAEAQTARDRAGGVARQLGAPVLIAGDAASTDGGDTAGEGGSVRREIDRLGAETLFTVGDTATRWARRTARDGGGRIFPIRDPATTPYRLLSSADLDPIEAPEPPAEVDEALVLVTEDTPHGAALATARAAGADVRVLDRPDPRASPRLVEDLSRDRPETVLALGAEFGTPEELDYLLDVATSGTELPGGGQVLFPRRQLVALYGHPNTPSLGVLGEQSLPETIARAKQRAASYQELVDVPVVPTFEIIATIASSAAGEDGDYSDELEPEALVPWVEAAEREGIYVIIDLQPGRTDFLTQARRYEKLLTEPHVGLALDSEWRLKPDEVHLEQIGSVDAAEINTVIDWLARLTRRERLPQKLLMLHQFRNSMITNRSEVDISHRSLSVLVHADGNGPPDLKFESWNALRQGAQEGLWWGWKNFYDEDTPTFTPEQTMNIEPRPKIVTYQ